MRLCSIASGSSGNCVYVGSDTTHLLLDAGISGKRVEAGLQEMGLKMGDIDGIFITHEHADHISGLGVLARKYGVPIYGTKGTIEAVRQTRSLGKIDEDLFRYIRADEKCRVKDVTVYPIRTSHDAAESVAYRVSHDLTLNTAAEYAYDKAGVQLFYWKDNASHAWGGTEPVGNRGVGGTRMTWADWRAAWAKSNGLTDNAANKATIDAAMSACMVPVYAVAMGPSPSA